MDRYIFIGCGYALKQDHFSFSIPPTLLSKTAAS
jgi:hypothetical protein